MRLRYPPNGLFLTGGKSLRGHIGQKVLKGIINATRDTGEFLDYGQGAERSISRTVSPFVQDNESALAALYGYFLHCSSHPAKAIRM
jgi:hypothetical protein